MDDEDVLPTHHPLHEYISSLGLYDTAPSAKHVPYEYTCFTTSPFRGWHLLCRSIKEFSRYLCLAICFMKLSIVQTILTFPCWLNEDEIITHVHRNQLEQQLEYGPGAMASNILFYTFLLGASFQFYLLGHLTLSLLTTFPLLTFIFILFVCLVIQRLLFSISCMTIYNRNVIRKLIVLLQQAELSFGQLPTTPSSSLYPDILKGFHQLTRHYTVALLNLSLYLSFEHEVLGCLSTQQLGTLKDQIDLMPQTSWDLKIIKMHREMLSLLEMDMVHRCSGIVCLIHPLSAAKWFRLLCVIWCWRQSMRDVQKQLCYYDHFRTLLLEDRPPLPEIPTSSCEVSKIATINVLLLHLTVTLQSAHDLRSLLHEREQAGADDTDSGVDRAILLFNHIHQQLLACSSLGETMYTLLVPNNASSCGRSTDTEDMLTKQAMGVADTLEAGRSPVTSLKAQDIDPEDDVLEDTAIGNDERDQFDDLDDLTFLQPAATLHPSILKELNMAIACRRLQMEVREREALRKRGGCLVVPNDAIDQDTNQTSHDTLSSSAKPLSSEQREYTETNGFHERQTDSHLESFFSSCTTNDSVMQQNRKLKQRSAANPRNAVGRRHHHFQRAAAHEAISGVSDVNGTTRQPESVTETARLRPSLPVLPFVSSPDFAAALLKERQRKGYADLEVFGDTDDDYDDTELLATYQTCSANVSSLQ